MREKLVFYVKKLSFLCDPECIGMTLKQYSLYILQNTKYCKKTTKIKKAPQKVLFFT